ncbi:MAG: allophanate hydrolase [Endomicrobium sp.]|nr:allophanate hydrolase [Endomicrobium sp.]
MLPQKLTISYLRKAYLDGVLQPEDVLSEILARVGRFRQFNIWISEPSLDFVTAYIKRLKTMDIMKYPLWGIPFAVKDNIDVKGLQTSAGCPKYAYTPSGHAAVVQNLINAGAIPLGKTNLDQFATGLVGARSPYGQVKNALKPELISGGSSSGSAVSVALGQAAFALGTDTAGSGRVPAALNGIFGFKPSCGAWPVSGVVPACESLDCVSVFANNIDDCAAVDNAARKYESADIWSKHICAPLVKQAEFICLPKNELKFFGDFALNYKKAWNNFTDDLISAGAAVKFIDTEIFSKAAQILYAGAYVAERYAAVGNFIEKNPDAVLPVIRQIIESGKNKTAVELFKDLHSLQKYKKEAQELLKGGVLIMPTAGGAWTRAQVEENPIETNSQMGLYTNHCNLLDLSACAIPYGFAGENLPFGISAFALSGQEGLLFSVAAAIENIKENAIMIAVHGLHMRGFELNGVLLSFGAEFVREDKTSPEYKMFALQTQPAKPGLVKVEEGGAPVKTEIWKLPARNFAGFLETTASPLAFGKIKLYDGSEIAGFLCEPLAVKNAKDITEYGGWREYKRREQIEN